MRIVSRLLGAEARFFFPPVVLDLGARAERGRIRQVALQHGGECGVRERRACRKSSDRGKR